MKKAASNAWNTVKRVATNTWNTVKSAVSHAVNWVGNKVSQAVNWVGTQVNHVKNWAVQQWNNYHSAPSYQASSGSYGGGYHSSSSSHAYAQQQQAQARAQAEQRRQQHIRDEYSQSTGIKTTPKTREAKSMFRNWGKALKEMYTHVCKTAKRVKKQVANYVKKIDWKKVAVTAGAIGVGIALTVATGGLGAPIAMAIGGAASGAILSGYDAYSSGQRGWGLAGSTLKGAGLGAITGFVGGQFIGAGANVAANVTQNIANQTVRHVVSAGVEAGVETAIDTGISLATGNPISLKNVATDYGLNLITNGSGSVSSKKSATADVPKNKPKSGNSTSSASPPKQDYSQNRKYWKNEVEFNGNKVYQRDDLIDPNLTDTFGRTNVDRMKKGLAPIGPDGKSMELHHMTQRQSGSIAEVTKTFHNSNYSTIHINTGRIP